MPGHMLGQSIYLPKELNFVKKVTLLKLMRGPMMTAMNIGTVVVRPHTWLYIRCGPSKYCVMLGASLLASSLAHKTGDDIKWYNVIMLVIIKVTVLYKLAQR